MRSLALSLAVSLCLVSNVFGLDWVSGVSSDGVANTTSKVAVAGVFYRVKYDGTILQRPSGTSSFKPVRLDAIPVPAKALVAARYDQFVPASEQEYSSSTLRRAAGGSTTTDSSDRSQRTRTDTRDRHDQYDSRQDYRRYDQQYRDRDIRYRAYTEGANSPSVVMANNYLESSQMSVDVHPVSEVATMAAFAENRLLIAELIAARRERDRQQQQQQVVQNVNVNVNCGSGCRQPCQQQLTTLETRCWRCGTHFTDQFGRHWQRVSGPVVKPFPAQLQGTLGRDAQGRVTFTTSWSGQTVVFVDP